jgi:hypothetical protein
MYYQNVFSRTRAHSLACGFAFIHLLQKSIHGYEYQSTHTVRICMQPGKFETLSADFEPMLEPYTPCLCVKQNGFYMYSVGHRGR